MIQCKKLPKKDLLSQADAFCVLWRVPTGYSPVVDAKGTPSQLPGRPEEEIGRTEIARATVDPVFKHSFRLEYTFHEEQTYVIRVYDEDLRYATALKEHDYLGGCVFTLGRLMGSKGCSIGRRLSKGKSFIVVTGNETVETCEVLEFRFSCQDLIKERSLYEQSRVLDKCNPYFRLEKLNRDDQSWDVIWKSEAVKRNTSPTWMKARLPLQLLCNGDEDTPLKITIWDYDKEYRLNDYMGFVESTISELTTMAKDGIPVFLVTKEKKRLFGFRKTKLKTVGLLKILTASKITVPSMLQFLKGGCSLDLMVGIDCSVANRDTGSERSLHFTSSTWLNDYQAGIQGLGAIAENFARGKNSSVWSFGAKINGKVNDLHLMGDNLVTSKELLDSYDGFVTKNPKFALGERARLKPLLEAATFRTIKACKTRQCYTLLTVFTAGDFVDLQESVDLLCRAAEDAPLSLLIIGVGNRDFSDIEKLCGQDFKTRLRDSRGIPIAREIVSFVSFKQFGGDADGVVTEVLKGIPEQFVTYFVTNGIKPRPPVPPPNYDLLSDSMSKSGKSVRSGKSKGSKASKTSETSKESAESLKRNGKKAVGRVR
eukprot:scaffold6032_cov100-Cylindrotheca_fusiformis.AAC.2